MSTAQSAEEIKQIVLEILASPMLTDGAKCAALAMALTDAQTAREVAAVCNKSVRTIERHYTDAKLLRKSIRQSAEEDTPIGGGGYAKQRTDEPAPAREDNSTRDCIEEPTVLSLSPQQQQAPDPIESGLLSLMKAELNLYSDAEARTMLAGQFRAYGEKNLVDAYSAFLVDHKAGREFAKPWRYIQQTARAMRDAPPPTPNVVAFRRNPNVPTITEALAAMEAAQ